MCCALSQHFVLSHHLRLSDKATSSDPDIRGLGDLSINSCGRWSPPAQLQLEDCVLVGVYMLYLLLCELTYKLMRVV